MDFLPGRPSETYFLCATLCSQSALQNRHSKELCLRPTKKYEYSTKKSYMTLATIHTKGDTTYFYFYLSPTLQGMGSDISGDLGGILAQNCLARSAPTYGGAPLR